MSSLKQVRSKRAAIKTLNKTQTLKISSSTFGNHLSRSNDVSRDVLRISVAIENDSGNVVDQLVLLVDSDGVKFKGNKVAESPKSLIAAYAELQTACDSLVSSLVDSGTLNI